jgi:hypothetical protein
MTNFSRRLEAAESRLPANQSTAGEKLRRRLRNAGEVAWFVGVFGDQNSYLRASDCVLRNDLAGAIELAENVNEQTAGAAINAFLALDLAPLTEASVIRLQDLLKISHPLDETDIGEFRSIIFSVLPDDYGFPRGQKYCN